MVIAVPLVRMMQVTFGEIVDVAAVRNRFMSAPSPVSVRSVVRAACMSRRTSGRIRATLRQGMFIQVPLVSIVKMAVMQIIDVTFVFDSGVSAA
jgi:hypothetical protein